MTTSLQNSTPLNLMAPHLGTYIHRQIETDLIRRRKSGDDLSDDMIEEDDIGSDSSPTSRTTPQRRLLQDHWFEQFPWLELDRNQNLFFCRICLVTGKENVFTKGKPVENPKKDHFVKHQSCAEHMKAEMDYVQTKSSIVDVLPLTPNTNDSGSESLNESPAPKRRRKVISDQEKTSSTTCNSAANTIASILSTGGKLQQQQQLAAQLFAMQTDPAYFMQQYITALYSLQQSGGGGGNINIPSPLSNIAASLGGTAAINLNKKHQELNQQQSHEHNSVSKVRMRASSTGSKDGKRRFQEYWFDQFPWLKLDPQTQLFFCKYCRDTGRNNSFAEGKKIVKNPKKHHFVQHQMTADHQGAVAALGLPPDNLKNIVKKRNPEKSFSSIIKNKTSSVLNTPTPSPPTALVALDLTNSVSLSKISPNSDNEKLVNWKKEFSWLKLIVDSNEVCCQLCKKISSSSNSWSKSIPIPSSKDVLYLHESSEEHQQAIQFSTYPSNLMFKNRHLQVHSDCGSDTDSIQSNEFDNNKQQPRAHSRKTISKWLKAYSWLRHNDETDTYTCFFCKEGGEWSNGIEAYRIERETIVSHEENETHKINKQALKRKNSILDDLLALKSACSTSESLPRVDWFIEFSWLELSPGSILHCRLCKNSENGNHDDDLVSNGLQLINANRDLFEKHQETDIHKSISTIQSNYQQSDEDEAKDDAIRKC